MGKPFLFFLFYMMKKPPIFVAITGVFATFIRVFVAETRVSVADTL